MSTEQSHNPTHGVTLQAMLEQLVEHYGWDGLGARIRIRCFTHDPSIKSSLIFLRRTPWAREQVEALFIQLKRGPGLKKDARPRLFSKPKTS